MKYVIDKKKRYPDSADFKLYRIRALHDFGQVKAGQLGGYVADESCLSQEGTCWVHDQSAVYAGAVVTDHAQIRGGSAVFDSARVSGHANVDGYPYQPSEIHGNSHICEAAKVVASDIKNCKVSGAASLTDCRLVDSKVSGHAIVVGLHEYEIELGGHFYFHQPDPSDEPLDVTEQHGERVGVTAIEHGQTTFTECHPLDVLRVVRALAKGRPLRLNSRPAFGETSFLVGDGLQVFLQIMRPHYLHQLNGLVEGLAESHQ
jgi:hypothetical protein